MQRQEKATEERKNTPFKIEQNLSASYDMWSWVYPEIATIRMEISRLGSLVRKNDINSPSYLESWLVQMKAMVQSIGIVNDNSWKTMMEEYKRLRGEIEKYNLQRRAVSNKKIPVELIDAMDEYYRMCIKLAQLHGLGIKIAENVDTDRALEDAFTH